jgi:hypothetical protein
VTVQLAFRLDPNLVVVDGEGGGDEGGSGDDDEDDEEWANEMCINLTDFNFYGSVTPRPTPTTFNYQPPLTPITPTSTDNHRHHPPKTPTINQPGL